MGTKSEGIDTVVTNIINGMKPEIKDTVTAEQIEEIKRSISNHLPGQKSHAVDLHGVLPLIFKRFYFVFSSGPDARVKQADVDTVVDQRSEKILKDTLAFLVGMFCFSAIFGYMIYTAVYVIPR